MPGRRDSTRLRPESALEELLLASASIVWRTDRKGEFVEEQPHWREYTGQDWREHRGSGWIAAVHPDDREKVVADWAAAVASGSPYLTQGRLWCRKHQAYRAFQTRGFAVRDATGEIEAWLGALTDIQDSIDLSRTNGASGIENSLTVLRLSEQKLLESEARLSAQADALKLLADCSSRLWHMESVEEGLNEIVRATIALLDADKGNIQLIDPISGNLYIAAHSGFAAPFLEFFKEVSTADPSACGRAFAERERVLIEDVEEDEGFAPLRAVAREAGFRAVQSTPLLRRDGTPLGILSTHFSRVHRPSNDDLALLDLYARQATDFIKRFEVEEKLRLLNREISHRSKNLLNLVTAIARRSSMDGSNGSYRRFEGRIQALAASQDLLTESDWSGAGLHDIVRSQVGPFLERERVRIQGPALVVSAAAVQPLAMALNELVTNATKHGSLLSDTGAVDLKWSVDGNPRQLTIEWIESGGAIVSKPSSTGFGTTVVTKVVERAFNGLVALEFPETGLVWRLRCELRNVIAGAAPSAKPETTPTVPVQGPAVLIVEDEPLVAWEMESWVRDAGFNVVGPAGTVASALKLLRDHKCGGAILDVNLGNETSEGIAVELVKQGIPFVTLSGYAKGQRPPVFDVSLSLTKPATADLLVSTLRTILPTPVMDGLRA